MKLIKDPKKVEMLAAEREDENWDFRVYLKGGYRTIEETDAIVHRINEEVTAQIDCTECANCCRVMNPILDENDIERLSVGLNLAEDEVIDRYLAPVEIESGYEFNQTPCPLLKDNRCSVYEHLPKDCRSFPHLQKEEFVARTIGVISNCSVCPIVFNVVEKLKDEVWLISADVDSVQ